MRELDLSILAANRADFEQYEENIRKEYSFVLNNVFYPNRAKIMEKFLDILRNGKLFYYLPDEYNKKAKENIEWLL
jgi:predicted metal-dependent HD superfamily phosphohydrolase